MHGSVSGALLVMVMLPAFVCAQTVVVKSDHPSSHVVQQGDTLWSIAEKFLAEPWRWREIWQANPQIKNPDLIYPGDRIGLSYEDGRPVLTLSRDAHPTVKLSPAVRVEDVDGGNIPTIPIDAIQQFLLRPQVVTESELEQSPYIVSLGTETIVGSSGDQVFSRGITTNKYNRYTVFRQGQEYLGQRDGKRGTLGFEAIHIADAILESVGDPSTLRLVGTKREVLIGDRLVPVKEDEYDRNFLPRSPAANLSGQIIAVVGGVSQIGQYQIVVLDLGTADGIETGHVMSVHSSGGVVKDPMARAPGADEPVWPVGGTASSVELNPEKQGGMDGLANATEDVVVDIQEKLVKFWEAFTLKEHDFNNVTLPDIYAGTVMVFRPFEQVSYALVMSASRAMHVSDTVSTP